MTLDELNGWGQNHGGIWAHSAPDYIMKSSNKEEIQEFIKGIYYCQDAGPVPVFTHDNSRYLGDTTLHLDIVDLLHKIGINTFIRNFVVLPESTHDATVLQMLLETTYKGRKYCE